MGLAEILAGAAQAASLLQQSRNLINEVAANYLKVKDTLSSTDQAEIEAEVARLKAENAKLFNEFDAKLEQAKKT